MVGWPNICPGLRCLGCTIVLVQSLICLLLTYALIIEAGNVLVNGCKKIGFYNYCSAKTTDEDDCHCITQFEDLHSAGKTFLYGLIVSLILTYSTQVFVFIGLLILVFALCFEEEDLWKFQLGLNLLSFFSLFLGTTTYLFLIWEQFDVSHMTPGFVALLFIISGFFLQSFLIRRYIRLNNVLSTSKTGGHAAEDLSFLVD